MRRWQTMIVDVEVGEDQSFLVGGQAEMRAPFFFHLCWTLFGGFNVLLLYGEVDIEHLKQFEEELANNLASFFRQLGKKVPPVQKCEFVDLKEDLLQSHSDERVVEI